MEYKQHHVVEFLDISCGKGVYEHVIRAGNKIVSSVRPAGSPLRLRF